MKTIRHIVVATDFSSGSQVALERALQLALAQGAALRLFHAFDVSALHSLQSVFDAQRLSSAAPPDVVAHRHLNDIAQTLVARTGLDVQARFAIGRADSAIATYVATHPTSLLIMGSRAESDLPGLGGMAAKVLQSPTCAVLVVRAPADKSCETVLTAVDLNDASARVATLALGLFPTATHHWLHALDPARERALWTGDIAHEPIEVLRTSLQAKAVRGLAQLVQSLTMQTAHRIVMEVVHDAPVRAIANRAAALGADCVAVSAAEASWGGATGRYETTQQVLQHTRCDVLIVP